MRAQHAAAAPQAAAAAARPAPATAVAPAPAAGLQANAVLPVILAVVASLGGAAAADEPFMASGVDSLGELSAHASQMWCECHVQWVAAHSVLPKLAPPPASSAAGSVQLRNELSSTFGLALPPTITFDHPTPAALAAFIAAQLPGAAEQALPSAALEHAAPAPLAAPASAPALSEVVGLACVYPGPAAAAGVAGFWAAAAAGSDLPTVIPLERWAVEQHYAPDVTGGWRRAERCG